MVNRAKDYGGSYNYRRIEQRRQQINLLIFKRIMGSILILLSFFIPIWFPGQACNGGISFILFALGVVLFVELKE